MSHPSTAPTVRALRLAGALAATLAAVGCVPTFPLLGLTNAHPLDRLSVTAHPALQHLGRAWLSDEAPAVGDLFDGVALRSAPDPSALLVAMAATNPEPTAAAAPLRMRTFNVGLLDVSLFGSGLPLLRAPSLGERRRQVFERTFEGDPDVVLLQEVWAARDIEGALDAGDAAGFACEAFHDEGGKTGLVTCVSRRRLVGDIAAAEAREFEGPSTDVLSYGGDVVRAMSWLDASLTGVGDVRIYNLHLSPMWEGRYQRMYQMRDVGLHARSVSDGRLVLLGGDLNAGPFYAHDEWRNADEETQRTWWDASLAYPLGLYYGGFVDLVIRARGERLADAEVALGRAIRNDPTRAVRQAHGDEGVCDDVRAALVTATDCNAVHFRQYAGEEPPSRLDHLWARDDDHRLHVSGSRLLFADREVDVAGGAIELSDHYGVEVEMLVGPDAPARVD